MGSEMIKTDYLATAREVFEIEAKAVANLSNKLDNDFCSAVDSILQSSGRVVVCGMGKSGIIAKKISATLASTGTPSFFMHPGEAYHGDLGMIAGNDIFIAISFSGETDEILRLLPFLKENGNRIIAFTGKSKSTLAEAADYHLDVGIEKEACPMQLAPTSSTTTTLVMGDALAVALIFARDFKPENFARFHPGGSLGRLFRNVEQEMIRENLPRVEANSDFLSVVDVVTRSNLGLAIVKQAEAWAIITDGDIRRAIKSYGKEVFDLTASKLMTLNPLSVSYGTRVEDALLLMERKRVSALLVLDGKQDLVGVFKK